MKRWRISGRGVREHKQGEFVRFEDVPTDGAAAAPAADDGAIQKLKDKNAELKARVKELEVQVKDLKDELAEIKSGMEAPEPEVEEDEPDTDEEADEEPDKEG